MATVKVKAHTRNGKKIKAHTRNVGGVKKPTRVVDVRPDRFRREPSQVKVPGFTWDRGSKVSEREQYALWRAKKQVKRGPGEPALTDKERLKRAQAILAKEHEARVTKSNNKFKASARKRS